MIANDITLWADKGGLIGLVMFSLFVLIGLFMTSLSKKDKDHRNFITKILDDERADRWDVHQEHKKSYDKLTDALTGLTDELKNNHKK